MKREFSYEEIRAYYERMAHESLDRSGREANMHDVNAFMVGAMCQALATLAGGNADDMKRFRGRLK